VQNGIQMWFLKTNDPAQYKSYSQPSERNCKRQDFPAWSRVFPSGSERAKTARASEADMGYDEA
jgi:hypothetical protein